MRVRSRYTMRLSRTDILSLLTLEFYNVLYLEHTREKR